MFQIALRWRIEKEVIEGKGQFICGNKKCTEKEGLKSWEVNFAYEEQGERKNTLIKLSKFVGNGEDLLIPLVFPPIYTFY